MAVTAWFLSIIGIFLCHNDVRFLRGGAYEVAPRSTLKGETNPTD